MFFHVYLLKITFMSAGYRRTKLDTSTAVTSIYAVAVTALKVARCKDFFESLLSLLKIILTKLKKLKIIY